MLNATTPRVAAPPLVPPVSPQPRQACSYDRGHRMQPRSEGVGIVRLQKNRERVLIAMGKISCIPRA
jgi:hypothetical protein